MTSPRSAILAIAALCLAAPALGQVEVTPPAAGVTSTTNDGNLPGNTVDDSLSTRWSGNGDGASIRFDLGASHTVAYVRLAVHQGNTRKNVFDLQTSPDGTTWTTRLSTQSSGTTTQLETHDFADVSARHVRYLGHGYVMNDGSPGTAWNSLLEVQIFAAGAGATPTPTPTLPAATPTPTPTPPAATPTPTPTPAGGPADITPPGSAVTASTSDANLPANTVDDNLATRWSGNGTGAWLRLDLGTAQTVGSLKIAFHQGDTRRFSFDLQVSNDNTNWTNAWTGQSSGTTTGFEAFDIADVSARYVRYFGRGNTVNGWSSLSEVQVWSGDGTGGAPTPTPTATAPGSTPTPTPSPTVGPTPTPTPTPTPGTAPTPDAGLKRSIQTPSPVTGQTRSIGDFGATSNNSSDDDGNAIRAAITAADAGDEIYIPNGTYHVKARRIDLKTGVSVRGQSRDGAVLHAMFTSTSSGADAWILGAEPGTSNLTLSSFTVTSNGSTSGTAGMNYGIWLGRGDSACTSLSCDQQTSPVSRIRVSNVNLQKFIKMGMNVRNGHDIVIENNWIHGALASGGGGQGYGVMLGYGQTEHCLVRGNVIEAGAGAMRHGILLQYRAHHNLVENNTVRNHVEDLIDLHGEAEYSNEIRFNTLSGSARACIGVGNTGGSTEHGPSGPNNWIHHNVGSGCAKGLHLIMQSHNQYIEDNDFHDNTEFGLQLYNGSGNNLRIRRNKLNRNPVGIRIEESAGTLLECNDVSANTSESLRLTPSVTSYTIRNNDFRGAQATLDSASGTYTNNCEDGNGITGCLSTCP